jgi:hypothetical protein
MKVTWEKTHKPDNNIKTDLNSLATDYANWILVYQNWNERSILAKK